MLMHFAWAHFQSDHWLHLGRLLNVKNGPFLLMWLFTGWLRRRIRESAHDFLTIAWSEFVTPALAEFSRPIRWVRGDALPGVDFPRFSILRLFL